ncbi:MAG: hypothetical protein ACHQ8D_18365 [Candidatus Rokuibacteriota bacterium]
MSANRTIALIGVLLAVVVVLAAAAPALAHQGEPTTPTAAPASPAPAAPTPPAAAGVAPEDPPVSDSPGLTPWIAAVVLLLAGLLLRRFSRRTLVLCLVLLLTLFAFENALHSVHHGFDPKQADACTLAMAATHLSAVTVDAVVETSIILAAAGHATEPGRAPLPARRLGPDQGRAPPARTA